MNYRLATIQARKAISADVTETIDIDVKDPISQLVITYECTNGSQAYGDGHPARCITAIELLDGSDVLFSLSGVEAQAADFYHNKTEPANILLYTNGMNSEQIYNLNFGRFLYDPVLALDPTKFDNPQLKISIDINAGGSLSAGGYLTVLAHLFDEKAITPTGFLMHKEVKAFTLANSSHEYTDLPTDHAFRKLFIRAQRYGTGPEYQIDTAKLSEDTDKRQVFNQSMFQLLRAIASQTRQYREWIIAPGDLNEQYYYCTPCYWPAFASAQWQTAPNAGFLGIYEGDGGRMKVQHVTATCNWQCHVQGWAPHGVIEIPFGLQEDPADWYDVTKIGNLKLDILGGSSVGTSQTCEVFLQQHRAYGA
ncbi:MAG: hypothetical protein ACFFBQ_17525 [Promethearchaeota archaeon]